MTWGRASVAAIALAALFVSAACQTSDPLANVCPILSPGALATWVDGAAIDRREDLELEGSVEAGELAGHPVVLGAGQGLRVSVHGTSAPAALMLYGPRDRQGGFPSCFARHVAEETGAPVTDAFSVAEGAGPAEYLVVVGARPGAGPTDYELAVQCLGECDSEPACPTLAQRGCPDVRCDGELVTDDDGCTTCECDRLTPCPPDRAAGPWGTCILPACSCAPDDDAPAVCGADGRTWASACDARCAGVAIAIPDASCELACPNLSECGDAACYGRRLVDDDTGCPVCECAGDLPVIPADCTACPLDHTPVCGSDGVTYRNPCEARCHGARILYATACASSCRAAPDDCALDCEWGLRWADSDSGEGECLRCSCQLPPDPDCVTRGNQICADFEALDEPVTVGSACLAVRLSAGDAVSGPCATACTTDADCFVGTRCQRDGLLTGRCTLIGDGPCGCGRLFEPVCGDDGTTWPNTCLARCGDAEVATLGVCCDAAAVVSCEDGERAAVTDTGCPDPDASCEPTSDETGCVTDDPALPACDASGAPLETTACEAHEAGLQASPRWCAP